jgi:periodic tryptophan protein 2
LYFHFQVKIWNNRTSFCIVTFDEHTSAVSCVKWTQSGKAILSASLDGTVRAHDMKRLDKSYYIFCSGIFRYRNFRTLVCPEPTQLGSLVVDKSGDLVVAAGKEVYNVSLE